MGCKFFVSLSMGIVGKKGKGGEGEVNWAESRRDKCDMVLKDLANIS